MTTILHDLSRTEQHEDDGGAAVPAVLVGVPGEGRWRYRDALSGIAGMVVVPVIADWPLVTVGPVLGDGRGCYECLTRRHLQRWQSDDPDWSVVVGDASPVLPLRGLSPAQIHLTNALVDVRLHQGSAGPVGVVAYNTLENTVSTYSVIPVVGCVTCGGRT